MGKQSREKRERNRQEESREVSDFRFGLEKIYFSIIEWGTYLIIFTPFILVKSYFFPFVVPKTIFFRIIVDIIAIAYILLVISKPKYLPKFSPLTIAIAVFVGILVLTSFTGINFLRSFWSVFERMTGLLTMFHLYAFFIILTSVFKEKKYWERILTVSILVGVLITFYVFTADYALSRGGGTLGNVSFLAAYLLFDIFFALALFFVKNGGWKIFYGASFLTMLSALIFAFELPRGGIASFFFGIFLLVFGYMLFSKKKLLVRLAPVALILIILVGWGVSQTKFFKEKMFDIKKDIPGPSRQIVWEIGWQGWKEKPWLGWGLENFNISFAKYFNPSLPLTYDVWYDRVHNIVLDLGVESGILGLTGYLAVFIVAIFGLIRVSRKVINVQNVFLPLGMICVLATYFLQNLFVFDMVSSYMIFFLSLAFIDFLISPRELQASDMERKPLNTFLGALMIVVFLSTIYFGNIQPASASKYTVLGLAASSPEQAIDYFQKALAASPMSIFEASEQFSKKMTNYTFDQNQNKTVLKNGFELAAENLKKCLEKNPEDYRIFLVAGRHYNDFFQITQDPEMLKQAEEYLTKAVELSPKNQQTYWSLAQTMVSEGKAEKAIELMQKSVDLEPRYSQSYWYLAMAYKFARENEKALETIKEAEAIGFDFKSNLSYLSKVIEINQDLQNDNELFTLYPLAIKMDPNNAQYKAGFAVTLANLGEFDKAREMANEALKLNPGFADQLKEFLDSLPQ